MSAVAEPSSAEAVSAYEVERGKPMPSMNHGVIQTNLLVGFANHPQWRAISEVGLKLGGREGTPDISVFPRVAIDFTRDVVKTTTPPAMIVEILSPTQGSVELMERVDHYLANGVKSAWVVEPVFGDVLVCTVDGQRQKFSGGVVTDPVTGLSVDLAAIFA
jgi:Uma2 family endonuclease